MHTSSVDEPPRSLQITQQEAALALAFECSLKELWNNSIKPKESFFHDGRQKRYAQDD